MATEEFHYYEKWIENETRWNQREKTVTMTNGQWLRLVVYLEMSTKYREGQRDVWANLAQEVNPDGTTKFKHAADNSAYWQEVIDDLKVIQGIIERDRK